MTTGSAGSRSPRVGGRRAPTRAGAAALLVVAGVHLHLYAGEEYARIPTIGWLFLATAAAAVLLAGVLVVSERPAVGLAVGAFAACVLGGYVLSLELPAGLFAFKEPGVSYSGAAAIVAEAAAAAAGLRLAWTGRADRGPGGPRRRRGLG